ncbi:MAG: 50S ribosomal protein L29 [Phycisphaeraceae bacterium]|nr:50S ribosomal protein L29 [Phycisphaeraceae bacterium]
MTGKEVRGLTAEEIGVELKRLRDRLYQLRTQAVTEKVEDNSQFRKVRRDIARLLTERRSRAAAK